MTPAKGRRAAVVAVALMGLAFTFDAFADDRPRIVVVTDGADTKLAERMRDEFETMGFAAELARDPPGGDVAADLAHVARETGAVVGVRAIRSGKSVQLWLVDRTTGKTLLRVIESGSSKGDATTVIRAVELLRASLLELRLPTAKHGDVAPSASLLETVRVPELGSRSEREGRASQGPTARKRQTRSATTGDISPSRLPARHFIAIELGPAVVGSPGGLPPFAALAASIGTWVHPRVRVGVFGLAPLMTMDHDAAEGSSETRVGIVGVDVRVAFLEGPWIPSIAAGTALAILATQGRASGPPFGDRSETLVTVGGYLRPGVAYEPLPLVALRAEALLGTQIRPFAIEYAGREVARWGSPWFGTFLSIEARVP